MQLKWLLLGLTLTINSVSAGSSAVETTSDSEVKSTSTLIEGLAPKKYGVAVCHRMKSRVAKLKTIQKAAKSE